MREGDGPPSPEPFPDASQCLWYGRGFARRTMAYRPARGARLVKRRILGDRERVQRATHESLWAVIPKLSLEVLVVALVIYWFLTGIDASLPAIPYLSAVARSLASAGPGFSEGLAVAILLVFVIGVALVVRRMWKWSRYVLAVTNFRILHIYGILGTEFEEIPLIQVRNVDVDQRFWERLFRIGWLRINSLQVPTSGTQPPTSPGSRGRRPSDPPGMEVWLYVPNPYGIEKDIESQTEELVAARAQAPVAVRPT